MRDPRIPPFEPVFQCHLSDLSRPGSLGGLTTPSIENAGSSTSRCLRRGGHPVRLTAVPVA